MRKKNPNKPFHSGLTYQANQETAVAEILFLIIGESSRAAAFVGTVTPNGESPRRARPGLQGARCPPGQVPSAPSPCVQCPPGQVFCQPQCPPGQVSCQPLCPLFPVPVPTWAGALPAPVPISPRAATPGALAGGAQVPPVPPDRPSWGRGAQGSDPGEELGWGSPTGLVPGCACPQPAWQDLGSQ